MCIKCNSKKATGFNPGIKNILGEEIKIETPSTAIIKFFNNDNLIFETVAKKHDNIVNIRNPKIEYNCSDDFYARIQTVSKNSNLFLYKGSLCFKVPVKMVPKNTNFIKIKI